MDFDALVGAIGGLEGRSVRLQVGTPGHETVALETTGPIRTLDGGDGWAAFTIGEAAEVRMNLGASEFGEAESSLDGSGSLRFLCSGVEFYLVPANRR